MEYAGQLWGGPEHGNLVSSIVEKVYYESWTALWLDGAEAHPARTKVNGTYDWNVEENRFDWNGPGADGDTLERLRVK